MLASGIPYKFQYVWAQNAGGTYTRVIPPTTSDPNAASQSLGFPPNTFLNTGAGGEPPDGRDGNGGFNYVTAWNQWAQAGMILIPYDATFSASIGGYPQGAVLQSGAWGSIWISEVDNNTSDPDTGGANWQNVILPPLSATDTGSANALAVTLNAGLPNLAALGGWPVRVKKGASVNTGACTLQVTDFRSVNLGSAPIIHPDGTPMFGGELPASGILLLEYDGANFQLQGGGTTSVLPWVVKAWAGYEGTTQTLFGKYNVSSVTYNGVGNYSFNISGGFNFTHGAAMGSGTSVSGWVGPLIIGTHGDITGANPSVHVSAIRPDTQAAIDGWVNFYLLGQ